MSRTPKPPRLVRWRGHWYVFATDRGTGLPVRVKCKAHGAKTKRARRRMLRLYQERDESTWAQVLLHGGRLDFNRNMREAVGWFLDDVKARRELRAGGNTKAGLEATSADRLTGTIEEFRDWLPRSLTTGRLDRPTLARFFVDAGKDRSDGTMNIYRRNVKACLRWLNQRLPKLFPYPDIFNEPLKLIRVEPRRALAFTPDELRKLVASALRPEMQRLVRFYALTGCRRSEAIRLTWDDVDLERGFIYFRAGKTKTGISRVLPCFSAPEGKVCPGLIAEMKDWPRGDRLLGFKRFPRTSWASLCRRAKLEITPQMLRRNFVSYCASMGVPASVCALWTGHSASVAERFYRGQVLERGAASSLEAAMGLA